MERKRKPGRPPLGPEAKPERVVAMMTSKDRLAAEVEADAAGVSLSVYAARAITGQVRRDRSRRAKEVQA